MRQLHELILTRSVLWLTTRQQISMRAGEQKVVVEAVQDGGHVCLHIIEPVDVVIQCKGHRALGKSQYRIWPISRDVQVNRVS